MIQYRTPDLAPTLTCCVECSRHLLLFLVIQPLKQYLGEDYTPLVMSPYTVLRINAQVKLSRSDPRVNLGSVKGGRGTVVMLRVDYFNDLRWRSLRENAG